MISPLIIDFLNKLKVNNNKEWFDAHRHEYDEAREIFLSAVGLMIREISNVDPAFRNLQPKECVFRINRDVRFSKDKRPYKHTMSAYFNPAGKKAAGPGYYMHIEPGNSFVAAGIWLPETNEMKKVRQEIDYNFDKWKSIITTREFMKNFGATLQQNQKLVRPPKGYDLENPAIDYLRLKSFVISHPLTNDALVQNDFMKTFEKLLKAAFPYNAFLKAALD